MKWFRLILSVLLLAVCLPTLAQDNQITLSIRLMDGMQYLETGGVFDRFRADHPDVQLHISYDKEPFNWIYPYPEYDITDHLDGAETYAASADVLLVSAGASFPPLLSPEASRAGYFLNLAPLIQADADFDSQTFYPVAWESVNWDGGVWMLPLAIQIHTLIYDRAAFDAAGVPYPSQSWNLTDFVHAIEALTPRNAEGIALTPGFIGWTYKNGALWHSLTELTAHDTGIIPNVPDFIQPDLLTFVEAWSQLYSSGAAHSSEYPYADEEWSPSEVPLTIGPLTLMMSNPNPDIFAAPFPGDRAAVGVHGLAMSGFTEHPELAYHLVQSLAADPRMADAMTVFTVATTKARHTYPDFEPIDNASYLMGSLSEENEALLETALQNSVPVSELRFYEYVQRGMIYMAVAGVDAQTAMQDAQQTAEEALRLAEAERSQIASVIPTPIPPVELPPGEIRLTFRVDSLGVTNQEAWEQFAAEFVSNDAEVGDVVLVTNLDTRTEEVDCYYLSANAVPTLALDTVINLDPLLDADPTFDPADLLPSMLDAVRRDGITWALPMDIQPAIIRYGSTILQQAAVSPPQNEWTIDTFTDVLNQLQNVERPVLGASNPGTAFLMLIAAYGGLPLDYRTSPVQVQFTNPAAINAIQQVLDLARDGLIQYEPLSELVGGAFHQGEPLFMDVLQVSNFSIRTDGITFFPPGTDYNPISYDLGTAYISASSLHPESCYRFIRAAMHRPELLFGLPVVRPENVESTPALLGDDALAFYDAFAAQLEHPNRLVIPGWSHIYSGQYEDFIVRYWLFRAFDRYVLDDANLETELADAQQYADDFLTCAAGLPDDTQPIREHTQRLIDCAVTVDPISESYFRFGSR